MKKLIFISILSIFVLSCEKVENETTDQVSLRSEEIWKNYKFKSLIANQFNLLIELSLSNVSDRDKSAFVTELSNSKSDSEVAIVLNKYNVNNSVAIQSLYNASIELKANLQPIISEIQSNPNLGNSINMKMDKFAKRYSKLRPSITCGECVTWQILFMANYFYYFGNLVPGGVLYGLAFDSGFKNEYKQIRSCFETCSGSATGGGGELYLDPDNIQ